MNNPIRLQTPQAGEDDPRRLNPFPGRHLGEREFELLQAYVDDRMAPLVATLPPGIVSGLGVKTSGSNWNTLLRFQPGSAVGAGGQLVRLFYPLDEKWSALVLRLEKARGNALPNGYYFLTLDTVTDNIDTDSLQEACNRTEADPLRERRVETLAVPGLRFISDSPRLMSMTQTRAVNRLCVSHLDKSPFDAETGQVPVALVKVMNRMPAWIDLAAGRFMSEPDSAQRVLLNHWIQVLRTWHLKQAQNGTATLNWNQSLASVLGVDYLPPAGPFPAALLKNPAGTPPTLAFQNQDLQIELLPVPANTLGAVLEQEAGRGPVDLVHNLGERLRLLLAIPDLDYRPDLLDQPQRDTALEDELFHRAQDARDAWVAWRTQWLSLFQGLNSTQLKDAQAPRPIPAPLAPDVYRSALVSQRQQELAGKPLTHPYSDHQSTPKAAPSDYTVLSDPTQTAPGLYAQAETLRAKINDLESDLDESYRLINELTDYLSLQRQNYDSLSVSFSVLAGGVAGDGTGQNLLRWSDSADLGLKKGS